MHTFKDKTGADWRIEFDIPIIEDIKRELDIDLLHLGSLQQLNEIRDSSLLLIDVLEIVCAEQIQQRELDARGFAKRFDGETIDQSLRAVMEGLVAFFPPGRRPLLAKALANGEQMVAMLSETAMKKLDDPEYWQKVADAIDVMSNATPGRSSTNSPASPASATCASAA